MALGERIAIGAGVVASAIMIASGFGAPVGATAMAALLGVSVAAGSVELYIANQDIGESYSREASARAAGAKEQRDLKTVFDAIAAEKNIQSNLRWKMYITAGTMALDAALGVGDVAKLFRQSAHVTKLTKALNLSKRSDLFKVVAEGLERIEELAKLKNIDPKFLNGLDDMSIQTIGVLGKKLPDEMLERLLKTASQFENPAEMRRFLKAFGEGLDNAFDATKFDDVLKVATESAGARYLPSGRTLQEVEEVTDLTKVDDVVEEVVRVNNSNNPAFARYNNSSRRGAVDYQYSFIRNNRANPSVISRAKETTQLDEVTDLRFVGDGGGASNSGVLLAKNSDGTDSIFKIADKEAWTRWDSVAEKEFFDENAYHEFMLIQESLSELGMAPKITSIPIDDAAKQFLTKVSDELYDGRRVFDETQHIVQKMEHIPDAWNFTKSDAIPDFMKSLDITGMDKMITRMKKMEKTLQDMDVFADDLQFFISKDGKIFFGDLDMFRFRKAGDAVEDFSQQINKLVRKWEDATGQVYPRSRLQNSFGVTKTSR